MNNKNIRKPPCNRHISSTSVAENIRVIIRVRPPNKRELNYANHRNVINLINEHTLIFDPKEEDEPFFYHGERQKNRDIMKQRNKNLNFTFDAIFGYEATNNDIFESTTKDLVETLINGYNCSVFAYGATGAGKTHTMLGSANDYGITYLTLSELFSFRDKLVSERNFEITISYLEVYNETIKDLLAPGSVLNLCDSKKFGVVVNGLTGFKVIELKEIFELLEKGNSNRSQHATDANAESSRSHAVFQVYIKMTMKTTEEVRIAKLSMIDLAGSEKGAATGFSGDRFVEGTNINKSLLALSNCINSLAAGKKYISYRDSKLTRLLKDSLGGNCKTVMLANISPSSLNYEDTYNTLKYAMRATKIKLNLQKNVVTSDGQACNNLNQIVEDLKKENEELKKQLLQSSQKPDDCEKVENQEHKNILEEIFSEKEQLLKELCEFERSEQFLIIKEQLKLESRKVLCMSNDDLANLITRDFKERDSQVDELRDRLKILQERSKHIQIKLENFLQTSPYLEDKVEKRNFQIECMSATTMVKCLKKVCDIEAEELQLRKPIMEQFLNLVKTPTPKTKGRGFLSQQLTNNHKQLIKKIGRINSSSSSKENVPTNLTTPNQNSKLKYKRLENSASSLNSTFSVLSGPRTNHLTTLKTPLYKKLELTPSPLNSTFVVSLGSRTNHLTTLKTPSKKPMSFSKNILQPISNTHLSGKVLKTNTKRMLKINCGSSKLDLKKTNKSESYQPLTTPKRTIPVPNKKTPSSSSSLNSSVGNRPFNRF